MREGRIKVGGNGGGRIRLGNEDGELGGIQQNTTSMIDVIFILLVFFVAVSQLKESDFPVNLPDVENPGSQQDDEEPQLLNVVITADGRVFIDDQPVERGKSLSDRLKQVVAEHGTDVKVKLRSDSESKSGEMVDVLSQLSAAGLVKVEFAVRSGRSAGS